MAQLTWRGLGYGDKRIEWKSLKRIEWLLLPILPSQGITPPLPEAQVPEKRAGKRKMGHQDSAGRQTDIQGRGRSQSGSQGLCMEPGLSSRERNKEW